MHIVDRLRRPEYTGANRCLPCTVVNLLIAAVLSAAVATLIVSLGRPAFAAPAGGLVFLTAAGLVYVRGYLVPGTPTLTKRYLPAPVLALFGKGPQSARPGRETESIADFDVESVLLDVGALEPCGDDLCLTTWYRDAWQDAVATVDADREALLSQLDLDAATVEFEEYGDAFQARVDETTVGTWESRAAFEADIAAASVLEDAYDDWDRLSVQQRGQVLNGLRLFLDTCPECGGTPTFGAETVQSCCHEYEVAAVTCGDCSARLFESEPV
ncbi:hypothetical protein [Haloarcula marina]|uniref:hypothetical protein n=1 Tax=Haloarcula marina TaxID=2961574 RepID=UPI0020B8ED45|nr:hypothetical protein [Halomicroarcula marina]